eukprot:1495677-Prymnesium_polylepis.1
MAYAWPEVELKGDALSHYNSGTLSAQQRDGERLLSIYTLSLADGGSIYTSIFTKPNRLFDIPCESLKTAAVLLSTIVREGIIEWCDDDDSWKQRADLEPLFAEHPCEYSRKTDNHAEGDEFTLHLFVEPADSDSEAITFYRGESEVEVELDENGLFFSNLAESKLNEALQMIDLTLETKKRSYPGAKNRNSGGPSGSSRVTCLEFTPRLWHLMEQLISDCAACFA